MASLSHRRTPLTRRRRLALATGVAVVAGVLAVPAVNAATGATATTPSVKRLHDDFNGDGYPDLAIGAPGTAPDGETRAGAVSVLYGASGGLSTSRRQVLNRAADEYNGGYGTRLQSADLDGDGYADLLSTVGQYMMDVDNGYALLVNWGGPQGLSATATTLTWAPQHEWQGGFTVADVDGDKRPDVVTGSADDWNSDTPDQDNGDGTVWHGPFTRAGQAAKKDYFRVFPDRATNFHSLTAGDVNGDGVADVVVRLGSNGSPDSRAAALLTGGSGGLTLKGWLRDAQGRIIGGEDAAIGDLNKDGYGDIVVGRPNDMYDSAEPPFRGGGLAVVYGGPGGVSTTRKPVWINQDTAGVPGAAEQGDGMGSGLSIGDTNGDGYLDVATGLPGEDFDGLTDAGTVLVLRGSANGLTATGYKSFSQNTSGVPGTAEKLDRFGAETALVDANADNRDGLVVGDPAENANNGSVWVFSATSGGITAGGSFSFGSATMGLPATGAEFGASLAD
ncbi:MULTISPECIES: FG-GAP-like repeat-containing protein [unclassified Streptomyces]|uniref:FG-GAP-like repeat-containing protein n=1 Tax=unclassified Streptomyces TaxID=2593676 RepID=UPI002365663A|nr:MULTISPECIES: FG-GAP-like repeat-containing protein [unclassified Streptomyces]MDF3143082.1 FG-GAP-like repeat-containing protein [Streptomyces sp. T21Q-yed]WDF38052.1 FG-GAP-like repeat-containing protein [Streptomyces sp. T12]